MVAITTEISNKVRYALFYKYIARSNILSMQASYDEAQTRIEVPHEERVKENTGDYGNESYKFPLPDFPLTQAEIDLFNKKCEEET